jgi:hypothetical protein
VIEFRRLGSSSEGVSSDALSPGRNANVGTVEASVDDVFTFPTLDRMVRIMGSTTDTLFTRGGWDLLEALITEAITQEMDGMGVLASSKREGISARKTGSSGISNRTIWFPRKVEAPGQQRK